MKILISLKAWIYISVSYLFPFFWSALFPKQNESYENYRDSTYQEFFSAAGATNHTYSKKYLS